jgi:hypothetical protein
MNAPLYHARETSTMGGAATLWRESICERPRVSCVEGEQLGGRRDVAGTCAVHVESIAIKTK